MTTSYTRRAKRLREPGLALAPDTRDRLRERAIVQGTERVARHLGVADRALLTAIAGVPSSTTAVVLARLTERGLP